MPLGASSRAFLAALFPSSIRAGSPSIACAFFCVFLDQGYGILKYPTGAVYEGGWHEGQRSGKGELKYKVIRSSLCEANVGRRKLT